MPKISASRAKKVKSMRNRPEFDAYAHDYKKIHANNITITGENVEYFAEYKIRDLRDFEKATGTVNGSIIDFGCGIGNSLPFLKNYFPKARIKGCVVSNESIEIARNLSEGCDLRLISNDRIPFENSSADTVFSACVFHHIPRDEYMNWLAEAHRVLKVGGHVVVYEHNPFNPLTVHAVNTCPLDANAVLINAPMMRSYLVKSGFKNIRVEYKLFFPNFLRGLRKIEKYLTWLPMGAQYRISGEK